ncbi:MAG: hypothetical protein IJZ89_04110 [Clostridia bacterium]|nr:hypothetical protein [Clostridia bacterium]
MAKKDDVLERRVYFKWQAKRAMGQRGNLLRFIGATFIMLAVAEAFICLFETVCYFIAEKVTHALLVSELFLLFVIVSPLLLALARMAYRMSLGDKTEIYDIFYYFNRERLRGAYIIAVCVFGEWLVQFALAFTVGRCIAYAFEGIYARFFSPLSLILAVIVMPFVSGVFTRAFILPAAYFEKEDLNEAFAVSKTSAKGQPREISLFNVSFLPLVLMSVLTLGILFFVYVLPLYMIASQLMASYFVGCNISENYRK